MIGLKKRRAGYYLKIGGGVCGIRRGKLATKKSRNIIGDLPELQCPNPKKEKQPVIILKKVS
jgi:hypothetical protein